MSVPTQSLPERPSLEQLRKRAKELLRAWRAGDPEVQARFRAHVRRLASERPERDAVLADAQLVLAREHGFESWAVLVRHIAPPEPTVMEELESLSRAVASAYTTGDFTALREIGWRLGTSLYWSRDEVEMQKRLPTWFASESRTEDLALADARHLVARDFGADSWEDLVASVTAGADDAGVADGSEPPGAPAGWAPRAPFYRIDPDGRTIGVRRPLSGREWDVVLAIAREREIPGIQPGPITDRALARLAELDHVTRVDLEHSTRHTDDGVLHLAGMPQLRELNLGGVRSPVTDRGLEVLAHLPELRRFALYWASRVSDAGIAWLSSCEHLEYVDLMGSTTGDGALRALAAKDALLRLKTGRQVSDAGLAWLHEIPAFATWRGGEPDYGLMSFESGPTYVMLDGPFTARGLDALVGLDGLFGLSFFWHTTALKPEGLRVLSELPRLGFLGCQGELCDDEAMRHIAAAPGLRMLMGQGTVASDEGFTALSRSRTIEYVWGRECPSLTGRGFAALATMPSLTGLAVSCERVDDAALATLPTFPSLRELLPMDVTDAGFRHVGKCERLENLWCMYCNETGDAATEHVGRLRHLRGYYAGDTRITDRSLRVLGGMDSLESLEFWQCAGITDEGVRALARLPKLREVTLEGLPGVTREVLEAFPGRVRVSWSG